MSDAMRRLALAALVAAITGGCEDRTYLLITVDVDPSLSAISQLRFVSQLMTNDSVVSSDEQMFPNDPGGEIRFPRSFLILADGRGKVGEQIDVLVEGLGSGSAVIARGRGQAQVVAGGESSAQITLSGPCREVDECLGGAPFCDNPHTCRCEGESCDEGFCEPIVLDDRNPCTTTSCDEETRVVTQNVVDNGRACTTADGDEAMCASGVCKLPACGDFIVDMGEECDEGLVNSDVMPLACRTSCRAPGCGDGVLDQGIAFGRIYEEECDEPGGNSNTAPDGCREIDGSDGVVCRRAFCGDGVLDSGERCDDDNAINGDGCNPTCSLLGEVTLVAGAPGGPGNADGTGADARLRDVFALAAIGNDLYFTVDEAHDSAEDHTLRRITLPGGELATVAGFRGLVGDADGIGDLARLRRPRGVASDGTRIYIGDSGNHRLKRFDPATGEVTTIAGSGASGNANGPLATATFAEPSFVAVRSATEILVMDTLDSVGCRLRRVNLTSAQVTTLAGGASCVFPIDDTGTDALFGTVTGMAIGSDGMLYVADTGTVRRVDLGVNPVVVSTIADGGDGLNDPLGGLIAGDGELFVTDRVSSVIHRIALPGGAVTDLSIAAPGLSDPRGVGFAGQTLLIADAAEHTLRAVDLAATPPLAAPVLAGRAAQPGGTNGSGTAARFDGPSSLALLTSGALDRLFVAEELQGRIRTIQLDTPAATVGTLASTPAGFIFGLAGTDRLLGTFEAVGSDVLRQLNPATGAPAGLPGQPVSLDTPLARGVAVLDNFAYVVATTRSVIRRVDLTTGAQVLFAGIPDVRGVADGAREFALFGNPVAIVACAGDLYVAESQEAFVANVIRKIDLSTDPVIVTTIAGVTGVAGSRDGDGDSALFDSPEGITCDGANLYVADRRGDVIRQIELATGRVSTLAGSAYQAGAVDGVGAGARFSGPQGLIYDPASGDLFVTDRNENVVRRIH